MEVIFIDANIFLEILLDDQKAQQCVDFLQLLGDEGSTMITTDFVVYACFIQVERNIKGSKPIMDAILFFDSFINLKILRPVVDDLNLAAEMMDTYKLDFDDGLVIACMKNNDVKKLVSLDKHFDKVKGIQRIKI